MHRLRPVLWCVALVLAWSAPPAEASAQLQTVELKGGGQLIVPAGAVPRGARIKVSYGRPGQRAQRGGHAVRLRLVGRRGRLHLRRPVRLEYPAVYGSATQIRTYDSKRRGWRRLTTRYDASRNTVSARLRHFSWFSAIVDPLVNGVKALSNNLAQKLGEKVGMRAPAARCVENDKRSNTLPRWVTRLDAASGPNDPLTACGQAEGDLLAVEFVNNRPYGIILRYGAPVAWGWTPLGFSLRDLRSQHLRGGKSDGLYIPPATRGSVGMPQGDWVHGPFTAGVSGLSLVADVTQSVLSTVSVADKAVLQQSASRAMLFMKAECVAGLIDAEVPSSLPALAEFIVDRADCIEAAIEEAVNRGALGSLRIAGREDLRKVVRVLKTAAAVEVANRFLELLRDAHIGSYGRFDVHAVRKDEQPPPPPPGENDRPDRGEGDGRPQPPPPIAATRVNPYDNYGPATQGHAMCRGNQGRPESMPGGTATQTFSVPAGVGSIDHAMVQIDPAADVTAHASLSVNGATRANAAATAAGDTHFSFPAVAVKAGDQVALSISFTASGGKLITIYAAGAVGGTFSASNSCPDGAPSFTKANGLRAVLSGWSA